MSLPLWYNFESMKTSSLQYLPFCFLTRWLNCIFTKTCDTSCWGAFHHQFTINLHLNPSEMICVHYWCKFFTIKWTNESLRDFLSHRNALSLYFFPSKRPYVESVHLLYSKSTDKSNMLHILFKVTSLKQGYKFSSSTGLLSITTYFTINYCSILQLECKDRVFSNKCRFDCRFPCRVLFCFLRLRVSREHLLLTLIKSGGHFWQLICKKMLLWVSMLMAECKMKTCSPGSNGIQPQIQPVIYRTRKERLAKTQMARGRFVAPGEMDLLFGQSVVAQVRKLFSKMYWLMKICSCHW